MSIELRASSVELRASSVEAPGVAADCLALSRVAGVGVGLRWG